MLAIAMNALFTSLRHRGTTRQLAGALLVCVISALLLLLALVWYNLRFTAGQVASAEVTLALVYVALWGWIIPSGVTLTYCLFTAPRNTHTALHIPLQKAAVETALLLDPPRYRAGVVAPFAFNEETPWGWLEYQSGNFHGQRLALKRIVATLGRDEDCDIWVDDEMASRHHAELAYDKGRACLTDCGSLNGVTLNGRRVHRTVLLAADDVLQIGEQSFRFIPANEQIASLEMSDPLAHHTWRSSQDMLTGGSRAVPAPSARPEISPVLAPGGETAELDYKTPRPAPARQRGTLRIREGEMAGQYFRLERAIISVGRDPECDVIIADISISRKHAQFSHQLDGDYVQDLGSRNGTRVNDEPLHQPKLLQTGDVVMIGNVHLEYSAVPFPPVKHAETPHPSSPGLLSGPMPLKLPSRQLPQR
jgi:pSer/pThr/pTyr-binding forkhead associated (FHA) protein